MIGLIGISHKTSALEVREQFSLAREEIIPFSEMLQKETGISDLVVLSTCNRTEIYFSQSRYEFLMAAKFVYKTLKQFKSVDSRCWHSFYSYSGDKAARHLFEVASALDSMVIGEDQIIGQIKEAYQFCTEAALTDAVLMRLFEKSFEAGKRVRNETKIRMGTTSVSGAAVQKCVKLFPELSNKRILLIGAGETGKRVLQSFHKKGIQKITVTNRTEERAKELAGQYNNTLLPFDQVPNHLYLYDIIIVATASPVPLVTREMVERSIKERNNKQQIFIDISVPRNIDQKVEEMNTVRLFVIDDLQEIVNTNVEKRKESIGAAREIIDELVTDFSEWCASRSLKPAIKTITYNLLRVTKGELSSYNKVSSNETQLAISEFSKHLTQKYTRLFIKNLKEITANGKNVDSLELINQLFKINEE